MFACVYHYRAYSPETNMAVRIRGHNKNIHIKSANHQFSYVKYSNASM